MAGSSRAPGTNRTECTAEELRASDRRRAEAAVAKRALAVDRRRFAVLIQAMWRGYCVRDALRMQQEQTAYLAVMFACMKIQRRFRNHLQLKAEREIVEREERQMLWAVWVVQSVARCFGPRAELARRKDARAAEVRALLMARSAVVIQKYWRGHLQRRLALWLREVDARRHLTSARAAAAAVLAAYRGVSPARAADAPRAEENPEGHEDIVGVGVGGGTEEDSAEQSDAASLAARREQHMAAAAKARASQLAARSRGW
jgi:hypothetical protein